MKYIIICNIIDAQNAFNIKMNLQKFQKKKT